MVHNRLSKFLQTRFHNFLKFTYKARVILHNYSNNSGRKKSILNLLLWLIYSEEKKLYKQRTKRICDSFAFQAASLLLSLSPLPTPSPVEEEEAVG